jgi:hypothetical protein
VSGTSAIATPPPRASGARPGLLLNAVLKSASSYITDMLIRGLGAHRSFLSVGVFPGDLILFPAIQSFAGSGAVAQQHFPASAENLAYLRKFRIPLIVHARDPRAIIVSWTHHLANSPGGLDEIFWYYPAICPPESFLARPFAWQLDWCLENHLAIFSQWLEGWRLARETQQAAPLFTTYEQFVTDRRGFFAAVLGKAGIDLAAFTDPMTPPGAGHLFRRGSVDEWRSVMDAKQIQAATERIPAALWQTFGWQP